MYDIIVVGARCAGSAVALLLARKLAAILGLHAGDYEGSRGQGS
jgi:flavin-dependent dehydrogenase